MKISKVFQFLFLMTISFVSCYTPKAFQIEIPADHIEFGYNNQKTSAFNAFVIVRDGSLFQKNAIDSKSTLIKKIPKKDADYVYNTVAGLKSGNSSLYQIGEEVIFVRIRKNNTLIQEWKWLKGSDDLPSDIKQLERIFTDLMDEKMR
jgi:hypothetical protein